ncbi:chemotaxis protein CheA [bacterium]|nr:chemotaxis protein CheA [bacterium]
MDPTPADVLGRAVAQLSRLDPGDRDAVVEMGTMLEEAFSGLSPEQPQAQAHLMTALSGLQAVFTGTADSPASVISQVKDAVAHALEALAETPAEEPTVPEACEDTYATPPTLDEVASLLVRTNTEDPEQLQQLATALHAVGSRPDLPEEVALELHEACAAADDLGGATPEQWPALLDQISTHLQAAMPEEALTEPTPDSEAAVSFDTDTDTEAETSTPWGQLPDDADPDLLSEFITETRDNISGAEAALLALETDPTDEESVNTVFRAFHTIKGTSAFLGLDAITGMAHRAESLLSRVRDHEVVFADACADLALRAIDMLKELTHALQDALGGVPMTEPATYADLMRCLNDPDLSAQADPGPQAPRVGDILVAEAVVPRDDVELVQASQGQRPIGEALVQSGLAKVTDVARALRTQRRMSTDTRAAENTVRVRTDRLDKLIEAVGELVIAHSMIAQDQGVIDQGHHELAKKITRTTKIIRELQDLSMAMRMVPLKPTFQKMARLARDVSHKCGKHVEFLTEGEDTEIDRNMVDIIGDPLVHLVRNAVDHGVESPEERAAAGKPTVGRVRLVAYHAGGNVVVEIQDDGKGLDRERILTKAASRGIIEADRGMSDSEVYNLILAPGFSTADKVTDVSGRGVGLDVVKRNVESLRGRVDISSSPGQGSTFSLRLPLTLAVTDGMLVQVGAERYIIPTANIDVSLQPTEDSLSTVAGHGEMAMVRDELMPIVRAHRLFGVRDAVEDPTKGLLVAVDDGDHRYALLVDALLGQQQVVAKSLGDGTWRVPGVSGGAILGDGRVGLILDTSGVYALAREGTGPRPASTGTSPTLALA